MPLMRALEQAVMPKIATANSNKIIGFRKPSPCLPYCCTGDTGVYSLTGGSNVRTRGKLENMFTPVSASTRGGSARERGGTSMRSSKLLCRRWQRTPSRRLLAGCNCRAISGLDQKQSRIGLFRNTREALN
jgi:hypothetical protein